MNRNVKFILFKKVDLLLMFNTKLGPMSRKFKLRYYDGPFRRVEIYEQSTFLLVDLHGDHLDKAVNGFRLKPFFGLDPSKRSDIPSIRLGAVVEEDKYLKEEQTTKDEEYQPKTKHEVELTKANKEEQQGEKRRNVNNTPCVVVLT